MSDFDWSRDNGNVVLRAYGSIAVHENPYGDVVIRQERDALEEDDHWVVIPVQDADLVAQAIIDKAREIKSSSPLDGRQEDGEEQPCLALPSPRQPMNGARQPRSTSAGGEP